MPLLSGPMKKGGRPANEFPSCMTCSPSHQFEGDFVGKKDKPRCSDMNCCRYIPYG